MNISLGESISVAASLAAVLTALAGASAIYVKLAIKAGFADFLLILNGTYLRTVIYESALRAVERRMDEFHERLEHMETADK